MHSKTQAKPITWTCKHCMLYLDVKITLYLISIELKMNAAEMLIQ